jgi:hypothetical protein
MGYKTSCVKGYPHPDHSQARLRTIDLSVKEGGEGLRCTKHPAA